MAIRVIESPKQAGTVQFKGPTATREYVATGSLVKLDIQLAILATAPAMETGVDTATGGTIALFLNKVSVTEVGGGTWKATCDYANTPDQWDLKFNIGTQTTKRQQAIKHIRTYDCVLGGFKDGPGDFTSGIKDFKGAIGVNGEEVAGVDCEIAKIEFTITLKLQFAALSSGYFWTVANMTPCVNNADYTIIFKGQSFIFPKGSLLFRGAPMTVDSDSQVTFTYFFAYSRNLTAGGGSAPDWSATTTYGAGAQVYAGGHIFASAAGGNLNTPPVVNGWTSDDIFQTGDQVTFGGHTYTSLIANNEGNDPSLNPADWTDNGVSAWTTVGIAVGEMTVGNSGPIVAEGWHYKWPWYGTTVSNGSATATPKAIVIDQVYDYGDLTLLNIPSTSS
jgi:hypothetical protein